MSENAELTKLYSQRILALAADISHNSRLKNPDASAMKRSPLCGSTVTVDLIVDHGVLVAFGQDVKACALGQASASVLGKVVLGRSMAEVQTGRDQLNAMLKSGGPPPQVPFDGLEVLQPAKDYKNRHASILLAFDATLEALQKIIVTA